MAGPKARPFFFARQADDPLLARKRASNKQIAADKLSLLPSALHTI
jgi:hypothetical protein